MAGVPETANISTAVDLSRLPAPTVVEQLSFESVRQEIIDYLQSPGVLPSFDATVESDPAVKLVDVFAWRELVIRSRFNDRALQTMLPYATGSNLDAIGARYNVYRLELDAGDPDNGIDPTYEADNDFRERIQLSPEATTVAGPDNAYVFHARSADATIRDASATSPAPGEVLISILSRTGSGAATPDQIAAVEDVLGTVAGNRVRPLTDNVSVQSATLVDYNIVARLTLYSGPDETVVLAAAQARLTAWLAEAGKLGMDATRAAINAQLFVEGVQNVAIDSPAEDVTVNLTQSAHCTGALVTVAGTDA